MSIPPTIAQMVNRASNGSQTESCGRPAKPFKSHLGCRQADGGGWEYPARMLDGGWAMVLAVSRE